MSSFQVTNDLTISHQINYSRYIFSAGSLGKKYQQFNSIFYFGGNKIPITRDVQFLAVHLKGPPKSYKVTKYD